MSQFNWNREYCIDYGSILPPAMSMLCSLHQTPEHTLRPFTADVGSTWHAIPAHTGARYDLTATVTLKNDVFRVASKLFSKREALEVVEVYRISQDNRGRPGAPTFGG